MDKIINLRDLLKHEILDLYSGEEQIVEGLPKMIEAAGDAGLKNALNTHLEATKRHIERLDKIKKIMMLEAKEEKHESFFSNLFGESSSIKSKGIEGLLKEAEKIMSGNMSPEATNAAVIGAAQKIEHYEIAGYGTAYAYATGLNLTFIATELKKTLDEEYDADDALTQLALSHINYNAEKAEDNLNERLAQYIDVQTIFPDSNLSNEPPFF